MIFLDLVIIVCGYIELFFSFLGDESGVIGISIVRALRLVRIFRLIRLLRKVRTLRELHKLATMMATCATGTDVYRAPGAGCRVVPVTQSVTVTCCVWGGVGEESNASL